jgi:hypothetical protein
MSRTRSRGNLEKAWYKWTDYNPNGTFGGSGTVTSEKKSNGEFQTTTDVLVPDFRRRQANGEVFINPFVVDKTRRTTGSQNYTIGPDVDWGRRTLEGMLPCVWSKPPTRPAWFQTRIDDAKQRTLLTAHSRVAAEDFLSLVTVAESAKTAAMMASPFGKARDLITRIVTRRLRLIQNGLNLLDATTNAWLEYRFGWKPVLYEMQGIREAYLNGTSAWLEPKRLVARASDTSIVWSSPNNVTTEAQPFVTTVTMVANYDHTAKVSSGVLYELTDGSLESATARRMGLRLSDVPSTIWELVPCSFVIDRFLDIGLWLQAIMPKPGVNVLGTWTTVVDRQVNSHTVREGKVVIVKTALGKPPATYFFSGGTYNEEIQSVTRLANPSIPSLPTVNYRDLNLSQQIDHAALIVSRLRGLKVRT